MCGKSLIETGSIQHLLQHLYAQAGKVEKRLDFAREQNDVKAAERIDDRLHIWRTWINSLSEVIH